MSFMKKFAVVLLFAVCLAAPAEAYVQQFYNYETGGQNELIGPEVDWSGQYYFLKRNSARTESYIHQNYSPTNKTPFITIAGNVSSFQVTSDKDASYLYYTMSGQGGFYRLPLVRNASGPVYEAFSQAVPRFYSSTFKLAGDKNQFLVYSQRNGRVIQIGLFAFGGGDTPLREWNCTLPPELVDNISNDGWAYTMLFEASTSKVWVVGSRRYDKTDGSWISQKYWFAWISVNETGNLREYSPSSEISGWDTGNFKVMDIGRYTRTVREYTGTNSRPDKWDSIREYDAVGKQLMPDILTTFKDSSDSVKPINDFFPSGDRYNYFVKTDSQKNLYLSYMNADSNWNALDQKFALFKSENVVIAQPEPDPSFNDVVITNPIGCTFRASPAQLPAGYVAEGSRWEIYKVKKALNAMGVLAIEDEELIYRGTTEGSANTHKVTMVLPDGEYVWRMAYDWVYSSQYETVRGATNWSREAMVTVKDEGENSGGGGGGCNTGLGMLSVLSLALMFGKFARKKG